MKETPFDDEIVQCVSAIDEAKTCLNSLLQKKANFLCPFKVGDTIKSETGKQAVIKRIKPGYQGEPVIYATFILKKGNEGESVHELYGFEWRNPVKVELVD